MNIAKNMEAIFIIAVAISGAVQFMAETAHAEKAQVAISGGPMVSVTIIGKRPHSEKNA